MRAARAYAGIDQEEVAGHLGVARPTYGLWENGAPPTSAFQVKAVIEAMAHICKLPVEFFTIDFSVLASIDTPDEVPA